MSVSTLHSAGIFAHSGVLKRLNGNDRLFQKRHETVDQRLSVLSFFTSVNEHESLPQAHTQEGVLHHQTRQASCQMPLWSRQVINYPTVPGGEQWMGTSISLSANTPWLGTLPVQPRDETQHKKTFRHTKEEFAESRLSARRQTGSGGEKAS